MRLSDLIPFGRAAPTTVYLPAERFFVRVVRLAPEAPAGEQVELALEGLAPFPLAQLYWGYLPAADGASAVVYAAHRRRFSAEETKAWSQAGLVVPSFLPLAGRPAGVPAVVVHVAGSQLAGAAWRHADDALPAAVLVRGCPADPTAEERQAFARDLASRAGISGVAPRFVTGNPSVVSAREGLRFRLGGDGAPITSELTVSRRALADLDVRDREFLAERRRLHRRGTVLWRVLQAGTAAAAVGCVLDLAALAMHTQAVSAKQNVSTQEPTVQRLETAHTLATRVDELARQRLRPFEMLVVLNDRRPASVQFVRTTTQGSDTLEIEAQTANAGDVSVFEQALHDANGVSQVKTRDIRAREGLTSFVITVVFKPQSLQPAPKGAS